MPAGECPPPLCSVRVLLAMPVSCRSCQKKGSSKKLIPKDCLVFGYSRLWPAHYTQSMRTLPRERHQSCLGGHLREEEPESWDEVFARGRLNVEPDALWAVGACLVRPSRLEKIAPHLEAFKFAFDCKRHGDVIGHLMPVSSADFLFAVCDDHPEPTKYGLRGS